MKNVLPLLNFSAGMALIFVIGATSAASNDFSGLSCEDFTNYRERYAIDHQGLHDSRLISEQMNYHLMLRDMGQVTGRLAIDQQGKINDRYLDEHKGRFRTYLATRLSQLGMQPVFERSSKVSFYRPPSPSSSNRNLELKRNLEAEAKLSRGERDKLPLDMKSIAPDDDARMYFWYNYPDFDPIRDYMQKHLQASMSDALFKVDLPYLQSIKDKVSEKAETFDNQILHEALDRFMTRMRLFEEEQAKKKAAEKAAAASGLQAQEQKVLQALEEKPDSHFPQNEPGDGDRAVNVVAQITGSSKPDQVVEIVVHYDSQGLGVAGADDNGSGIVTALELARVFSQNPPARTIRFVFTDREESDGAGSKHHVAQIKTKDEDFVGAFVLDMYGYARLEKPAFVAELGKPSDYDSGEGFEESHSFAMVLAHQWGKYTDRVGKFTVVTTDAHAEWGDHGPYWDEDFPALFIAQPLNDENPANHSSRDKIENLNWGSFMEVSRFVAESLATVAFARPHANYTPQKDQAFYDRVLNPHWNTQEPEQYFQSRYKSKPQASAVSSSHSTAPAQRPPASGSTATRNAGLPTPGSLFSKGWDMIFGRSQDED